MPATATERAASLQQLEERLDYLRKKWEQDESYETMTELAEVYQEYVHLRAQAADPPTETSIASIIRRLLRLG